MPKPVIYKSSEGAAAARASAQWGWALGTSGIPPAPNLALGWEPTPFAGQPHNLKDECKCHFRVLSPGCQAHLLPLAVCWN